MRSTRASAAISRLNARDSEHDYTMALTPDGQFRLMRTTGDGAPEAIGEPLPLDEFVAFVNKTGPQVVQRVSKLDIAFEQQLRPKK